MAAHIDTVLLLVFITGLFTSCLSQFELDDRFLEYKKDGMWLVEFYAPWCGHCKKLEPIYKEVAKDLKAKNSPVKVAKIDCTRFPAVASALSVKGFPTIIFFNGEQSHHHHGDRTKEDILEFVNRAQGPTVRKVSSVGKFNEAVKLHEKVVFFLYIGDDDDQDDLFVKYSYAASNNAMDSYFYFGKRHILGDQSDIPQRHPTIMVYKDKQFTEYEAPGGVPTTSSLDSWIGRERHATFPRMSGPSLNEVAHVADYLIILAVDSAEVKNQTSRHARVFDVIKQLAFQYKPQRQYQFLWMDEIETIQSIAMSFITAPCLLVLDPRDQLYYLAPSANLTHPQALQDFLNRVVNGQELSYGGTGFLTRIQHMVFDLVASIISIWQGSRVLFLLMFGLPTVVVSIVCYSLCCLETVDDIRDEDEDEDYDEEEEEGEDGERRRRRGMNGEAEEQPPALGGPGVGDREPPTYAQATQDDASPKPAQDKKLD